MFFLKASLGQAEGYEEIYQWAPNTYKNGANLNQKQKSSGSPPQIHLAYSKANEISSLAADFLLRKVQRLEALDTQGDLSSTRNLLGNFCVEDEETKQCKNRYVLIAKPTIFKLKNGIETNLNSIAELKCTKRTEQGTCLGKKSPNLSVSRDLNPPRAYLPFLPTYKDLQGFASTHQKQLNPVDYQNWLRSLEYQDQNNWIKNNGLAEPIREDFILTKKVPKDDESGDYETIIVTDAHGNAQYDDASFKRAHQEWELDRSAVLSGTFGVSQRIPKESEVKALEQQFLQPIDPNNQDDDTDYAIYANSRGPLVDQSNKQVSDQTESQKPRAKKGSPSPSVPAQASQPPKQFKAYTGLEQVDPLLLDSGQESQNSVIYRPENFSVEKVVQSSSQSRSSSKSDP